MSTQKRPVNTARTSNVSVRFEPRIHYLATLAAREQGRTVSSFIEWAVRHTLADAAARRVNLEPMPGAWPAPPEPLLMESFWDVEEADRFFNLATMAPRLLTLSEQRLWKLFAMYIEHSGKKITIQEFRKFWNDPSINTSHLEEGDE